MTLKEDFTLKTYKCDECDKKYKGYSPCFVISNDVPENCVMNEDGSYCGKEKWYVSNKEELLKYLT